MTQLGHEVTVIRGVFISGARVGRFSTCKYHPGLAFRRGYSKCVEWLPTAGPLSDDGGLLEKGFVANLLIEDGVIKAVTLGEHDHVIYAVDVRVPYFLPSFREAVSATAMELASEHDRIRADIQIP